MLFDKGTNENGCTEERRQQQELDIQYKRFSRGMTTATRVVQHGKDHLRENVKWIIGMQKIRDAAASITRFRHYSR